MKKIIDLTYDIHEGMLTFGAPWHPVVSVTQLGRIDVEGRETRSLTLGTHTGTQTDAPLHFVRDGTSIDQIPLEKLVGPVTILDFTHLKPNEAVTVAMLKPLKFEKKIIFKFGWGKYWNTRKFYQDYPFFSPEAAEYLVKKKIDLIGFDTCSPDDGRIKLAGELLGTEADSPIHKIFLRNGVVLLEYIANLDKLTDYKGWTLAALPLKLRGADGSPARAIIFK